MISKTIVDRKVNSKEMKSATLAYFRFMQKSIVATEVDYGKVGGVADVMVDDGKSIYEIEIKVDKQDLKVNELLKTKHASMLDPLAYAEHLPNYFYLCVPHYLLEIAKEWVLDVNPQYGILEYVPGSEYIPLAMNRIKLIKKAAKLHQIRNEHIAKALNMRSSSELCNLYEQLIGGIQS